MGKAGRAACIFTPWALTIVSFLCLILLSVAGWNKNSSGLNSIYFLQADFTNLDVSAGSKLENSTELTAALADAQKAGTIQGVYQVHMWNYCAGKEKSNSDKDIGIGYCSPKQSDFYFDPVAVWGLNATAVVAAAQPVTTSAVGGTKQKDTGKNAAVSSAAQPSSTASTEEQKAAQNAFANAILSATKPVGSSSVKPVAAHDKVSDSTQSNVKPVVAHGQTSDSIESNFHPVIGAIQSAVASAARPSSTTAIHKRAPDGTSPQDAVSSSITAATQNLQNQTETLERQLLGKSTADALKVYQKVSKWMFIAFEVSFWTTLATIVCGIFAIFSRWGSFLTWILSGISTLFTFAAVLTSTVLFGTLVGTLKTLLDPYKVSINLGTRALAIEWIAVACSMAATLFWLFSVCCCSGRSNPHHKGNKGGLWNAEQQNAYNGRGRGVRVEKTGGAYERVSSPFLPAHERSRSTGSVPMQSYGAPPPSIHIQQNSAYEPFRHASG